MKNQTKNIVTWTLSILLAFIFFSSGLTKILGVEMQMQNLESWGYPLWAAYPIGIGEVILAIGLLIPKFRKLTLMGIFPWAIVAVITHIQASPPQYEMIGAPILFALIAGVTLFIMNRNTNPSLNEATA